MSRHTHHDMYNPFVSKARYLAATGRLSPQERSQVEVHYRVQLTPSSAQDMPIVGPASPAPLPIESQPAARDATPVAPPASPTAGTAQLDELRALLIASGREPAVDVVAEVRAVLAEAHTLRALADDGRHYRGDLVNEAITEGGRAHGAAFEEGTYRSILESAPLAAVKQMRDDWRAQADGVAAPSLPVTPPMPLWGEKLPSSAFRA